jgi:hypothetical protein
MSKGKKAQKRRVQGNSQEEFVDCRVLGATTLAKPVPAAYPGGPSHEAGTPVYVSAIAPTDNGEISFIAPSLSALCISLAIRGMRRAKALKPTVVYQSIVSPRGTATGVANRNTPHLFDMFEACMLTATFSFAALEAFSNYFIAAKMTQPYTLKRKDDAPVIPAEQVPRIASLEEKLATILPDILGVQSPKGLQVWEQFKEIKKVRDAAVHLKAADVYYVDTHLTAEKPLLSAFFQENVLQFPQYALDMIEHFGPPQEGSQWFAHARKKLEADS